MSTDKPYSADRSLYGKLRRQLTRFVHTRPAMLAPLKKPLITFSFDDAPQSAVETGAAILERHGACGTYFIASELNGTSSHLGTFSHDTALRDLNRRGHEIACHTFSHFDCGKGTASAIRAELDRNREALLAAGLPEPLTFAYPYGDVSPQAKTVLDDRFLASRALHHGLITQGSDLNQTPAVGIEGPDGEAIAEGWMDKAKAANAWLVLYTHDVREQPSAWGCTPQVLERLVARAIAMGFECVTFAEGARRASAQIATNEAA